MAAVRASRGGGHERRVEALWGYGFVSIWVVGFIIFGLFPLIAAGYISLTNWDPIHGPFWTAPITGFNNYDTMLFHDPLFWHSIFNTIYYSVGSVAVTNVVALPLAMLLNQKIRGLPFFRTIFYLPAILPAVAATLVLKLIFQPSTGALAWILTKTGAECDPNSIKCVTTIDWFNDPHLTMPAVILFSAWGVGAPMLIYLAGLQGVDQTYYEAAAIDGATGWRRFKSITLPLITPVIFFNLIIGFIGAFQEFAKFLAFMGGTDATGGPGHSLLTTLFYIWLTCFGYEQFGYGTAMAFGLFVLIMIFTLANFMGQRRWVFYQEERT